MDIGRRSLSYSVGSYGDNDLLTRNSVYGFQTLHFVQFTSASEQCSTVTKMISVSHSYLKSRCYNTCIHQAVLLLSLKHLINSPGWYC